MKSPVTRIDKETFGPWAVVTGASSGIGKEFARQIAASGISVVLVARRLDLLEEVGREIAKEHGVQYRAVKVDLTDEDAIETMEAATHDLDVGLVVSNAGDVNVGEFLAMERGALLRSVRINVTAHLNLSHNFGPRLAKRGRGGLLLVSSMAASQGLTYLAEYAAAKAYVLILGEGLHHELKKLGLNVTVLLPGTTDTQLLTTEMGVDPSTMR